MELQRKGLEEFVDLGEAGKCSSTKQHTGRKQEATEGGIRMEQQ